MNNKDGRVALSLHEGDDLSESFWVSDDAVGIGEQRTEFPTGLVSLEYIKAAIRRSARFWVAMALIGLLAGTGYEIANPPAYQASTSVIFPQDAQNSASIQTDVALAQSRAVAAVAVHILGLPQSAAAFQQTYKVTGLTNDVLLITTSASSSNDAVHWADATAAAFLRFRANLQRTEQQIALAPLNQQVKQDKQQIKSIDAQINSLSARPVSRTQQTKLNSLQTDLGQATDALTNANRDVAATEQATVLQLKESKVLDAAYPLPHSRLKPVVRAAVIGVIAGLVLSLGIVILRVLLSDRLRRRDDVARALGAPVKLSVGTVRVGRRFDRSGLALGRDHEIRRVVAHLRDAVPRSSRRAAALAVVAVDDPRVAAASLASLAVSSAHAGMRVVLADLVSGAPAARLLGNSEPGTHAVRVGDDQLVLAVPDPQDVMPVGPRHRSGPLAEHIPARDLAEECGTADVLLTLATLDPSVGGDLLRTWAADAVVIVTAGRSSWAKIYALGELMRVAGIRPLSAVLVGADKTDDSVGVTRQTTDGRKGAVARHGLKGGFRG